MGKTSTELYNERLKRVQDTVALKKPDRVPFVPFMSFFPANYCGISCEDYMYDLDKEYTTTKKTILDFEPDMYSNPFPLFGIGAIIETLDFKQMKWPGHGVSPTVTYQFVEGEYMKAEEYDSFLSDPSDFLLRTYLPRTYGALKPLTMLPSLFRSYYTRIARNIVVLATPEFRGAIENLLKASDQAQLMAIKTTEFAKEMQELGFPPMFGGTCNAPFDHVGDFFRGTKGIMLDMYRKPKQLLQLIEKITPTLIQATIADARRTKTPFIFIPLHKGLDGFMSLEQFNTFYWPSLREVIVELINAGLIPMPLWEGDCTSRLEIIKDIPAGKAIYWFERTDMFKAKKALGDHICIRGNVPPSLFNSGTPDDIKDYSKKLIDIVGKGGGFIMDGAIGIPDEARPENVRAWADFTKEYGVYH